VSITLQFSNWKKPALTRVQTPAVFLCLVTLIFQAGFLIFVLVFVSRDFELGRNVSCEESTISPIRG